MKVGVWQSNYIPWKGYFDYINSVDVFCLYDEVQYTKNDWRNKHLKSIQQCYAKAPQKEEVLDLLSPIYSKEWTHLSPLNHTLIKAICKYIGITTKIVNSKNYELKPTRLDRLIHLNTQLGATTYLSGLNAKNYIDGNESLFNKKNIQLEWKTYGSYLKYQRITPLYSDKVSIIDLLMHIPKNQLLNYITPNG